MRMSCPSAALVGAALLAIGCGKIGDEIDEIQSTVSGVTNPLVAEVIFLGVAEPADPNLAQALDDADWESEGAIRVFLADASNVDDIANAPIEGATVTLRVGNTAAVTLQEEGGGSYGEVDGLSYDPGDESVISIIDNDRSAQLTRKLPGAADIDVPFEHDTNAVMGLDLSDYDFDTALAVVINESGDITYSNEPQSIEELYELTHDNDGVKRIEIPARAFNADSVYAVGVAGMMVAGTDEVEGVNTALSSYMVGQMAFYPVCTLGTVQGVNLCDQY